MALLDKRKPGWRDSIDLYTLDLGSLDDCILGQVFGDYTSGYRILSLSPRERRNYGFSLGLSFGGGARYVALTEEWKLALSV